MAVRGAQAAATRERILTTTRALLDDPTREVTLDMVAVGADTTVQTVLRHFSTKGALLSEAIGSAREGARGVARPSPTVPRSVSLLFDDYEEIGDRVVRMLSDEHRIPDFADGPRLGRRSHREWVEASFGDHLSGLGALERDEVLRLLLVATDVYVWKLLRRDVAVTRAEAERTVVRLIEGALRDREQ